MAATASADSRRTVAAEQRPEGVSRWASALNTSRERPMPKHASHLQVTSIVPSAAVTIDVRRQAVVARVARGAQMLGVAMPKVCGEREWVNDYDVGLCGNSTGIGNLLDGDPCATSVATSCRTVLCRDHVGRLPHSLAPSPTTDCRPVAHSLASAAAAPAEHLLARVRQPARQSSALPPTALGRSDRHARISPGTGSPRLSG